MNIKEKKKREFTNWPDTLKGEDQTHNLRILPQEGARSTKLVHPHRVPQPQNTCRTNRKHLSPEGSWSSLKEMTATSNTKREKNTPKNTKNQK